MANTIIGTLPIKHGVESNGSLVLTVSLYAPPAKMAPDLSLSYHSASKTVSVLGNGWALKGVCTIERTAATIEQDKRRGIVNYDKDDCFVLNGQRLVSIGNNEYRYEVEKWSKIVASGTTPGNPDYWTEYLPDGTKRYFGNTADSNIKAVGKNATRVWAISESEDPFKNHISYSYTSDEGAFYLTQIEYGGNKDVAMKHQRRLTFEYQTRDDLHVKYLGGSKIATNKILKSMSASIQDKNDPTKYNSVHTHRISYKPAPLTGYNRVDQVTLEDPSGATVRPLKFHWHDADPKIFEKPLPPVEIDPKDDTAFIMPMDVHATGKSDLVVVSKRLDTKSRVQKLHLDVHHADANGVVSATPSSSFDGDLDYDAKLFPLDFNGDGRNDILHVRSAAASKKHTLTVILSKDNGYEAQTSVAFDADYVGGSFHTGDFTGDGNIGLIYVSQKLVGRVTCLRFTQFVRDTDGVKFKQLPTIDGPSGTVKDAKIVVGDLNGDGAEDVFILTSKLKGHDSVCHIDFLESKNGILTYKPDIDFGSVADKIFWKPSNVFLPYSADEDGKTSLLAATESSGKLQLQVLRSTGPSLIAQESITTDIAFDGNIALARTSSTSSVDLVNTFNKTTSPQETKLTVLRFFKDKFTTVADVTQPGSLSSFVTYADLRGVGRSDCVLNTHQISGKLKISPMKCSATLQPVDFLAGYENGLGAKLAIDYAPLSDRSTYTTDDTADAGSGDVRSPLPASNALARNVSSSVGVSKTGAGTVSPSVHTRSQLAYFPSYVVKSTKHAPYAAKPDVVEHHEYTYQNARYGFEGRGWLGFEKVTKKVVADGSATTTKYYQEHPFVGMVSEVALNDVNSGKALKLTKNTWESTEGHGGKNRFLHLSKITENHYEDGAPTFNVDVAYSHDNFGNITNMTLKNSQPGTLPLSIDADFENDESTWVIGNKKLETVKQDKTIVKQMKLKYHPGSSQVSESSKWVSRDTWSTQTIDFDKTGNDSVVKGPGNALRKLTYDATYSNVASHSTYVAEGVDPLVETAEFDLALGKPITTTGPNGDTMKLAYDILGRVIQTSLGDTKSTKVVEKNTFETDGNHFFKISYNDFSGNDVQFKSISHIDGLNRVWRTETPRPDNVADTIYSDIQYDGSGRVVARSRDYLSTETPAFTTFKYDAQSRVIEQLMPAAAHDVSALTTTTKYSYASGVAKVTETTSKGDADKAINIREVSYLPNHEPSADKFVLPYISAVTDELGQTIRTAFDALGQPTSIKDPSGAELSLTWDGLGRVISRRVFHMVQEKPKDIYHTTAVYEDDANKFTIENKLTGSKTVSTTDWNQRQISKQTPDETLDFTYDKGGQYTKDRLASVRSSNGVKHVFDYDIRGNLATSTLSLDQADYKTTYDWSLTGELLSTTNADGSIVKRSILPDGQSIGKIELLDSAKKTRAWVNLHDYANGFNRPLGCDFGNGLKSKSSLSSNGSIASIALSKEDGIVHQQDWKIDAFSRIKTYDLDTPGHVAASASHAYTYDSSGQLKTKTTGSSVPDEYSYDHAGNLNSKNGKTFVNDGWHLTEVKNGGAVEHSFKYSDDGNLIKKINGSGQETHSMTYDGEGRVTQMNKTKFLYDFGGQLLKATMENGDVRVYVNQGHEVDIPKTGAKNHTTYLIHGYRRAALKTPAETNSDATVHYFHADHLGSVVAVSDESGAIITQYSYDSFGKASLTSGQDISRYKFCGKETFEGIYYYGARFYDADIGRFLTLDNYPVSIKGIRPSTFNMYTFSRNDPINFIDLNGNAPFWHWIIDAVLIGFGLALMVVPGANILAAVALGAVSGALLGAGLSGLNYDMASKDGGNDKQWATEMGIGAAVGAGTGAASAVFDFYVPAVSLISQFKAEGALGLKAIGSFAVRTTGRIAVNTMLSSGSGTLQQLFLNIYHGDSPTKDLGDAAITGAWHGALVGAGKEAWGFVKPMKAAKAVKIKFWKDGKKAFYRVRYNEKSFVPGKVSPHVEYPLRDTRELSWLASKLPWVHDSVPVTALRYLPFDEATML